MTSICSIHCLPCLNMIDKGISQKSKIYQELGLESLLDERWCRKHYVFHKVLKNKNPQYVFSLIFPRSSLYSTRNMRGISHLNTNHNFFQNSFFPSTIIEWNCLDSALRNSERSLVFETNILRFTWTSPYSVFYGHSPIAICLITRLRFYLSHLREHKFKHSFQDTWNPLMHLRKWCRVYRACSPLLSPICYWVLKLILTRVC